ncbi:unnamed protein product [Closterium sp. NIES-54]
MENQSPFFEAPQKSCLKNGEREPVYHTCLSHTHLVHVTTSATAAGITATAAGVTSTAAGVTSTASAVTSTAAGVTATAADVTSTAADVTATAADASAAAATATAGACSSAAAFPAAICLAERKSATVVVGVRARRAPTSTWENGYQAKGLG